MELYDKIACQTSQLVTKGYSSSFGLATRLFPPNLRSDIYNIYGLVRIADEIVDSYLGVDAAAQLDALEAEVYASLERRYSANLVVHAFQLTAKKCNITKNLITPFFHSMRLDTTPQVYTTKLYQEYIHGSAEVVGLMCLKVFVLSEAEYNHLAPGAKALGAAFQKVNFLRDLASDQTDLHRYYFPEGSFAGFNDQLKNTITDDIRVDFRQAQSAILQLPKSARPAVAAAYKYYYRLLTKLEASSASAIKHKRVRVNNATKLGLLGATVVRSRLNRSL